MSTWSPGFLYEHEGALQQAIVLETGHLPGTASVLLRDAGSTRSADLAAATYRPGSARLPVEPRDTSRVVTVVVSDAAGQVLEQHEVVVQPARRQTVHLLHHAHQDMGWAERPTVMRDRAAGYLDQVVDAIDATAGYAPDARFRWNAESAYLVDDYVQSRPASQVDRLMDAVRGGSVEIGGLYAGVSSELAGAAQISRLTQSAVRLRDRFGIRIQTAFLNDVPGWAWSLPSVLAQSKIEFLVWGPDPIRAMTHLSDRPPLYWAQAPDGRKVLTWQGPFAYIEAWPLVFHAPAESEHLVDRLVDHYRDPGFYPYDDVLLHTAHDFNEPQPALSDFVARWNEIWTFPRLRLSVASDFFAAIEAREDLVPTLVGAFPDAWTDGIGSAVAHAAAKRSTERRLVGAETLSTFAQLANPREEVWHRRIADMFPPMAMRLAKRPWIEYPADEIDDVYRDLNVLDEHTWGAVGGADNYHGHTRAHWLERERVLHRAEEVTEILELSAGSTLTKELLDGADDGLVLVNTTQWARDDLATVDVPLAWVQEGAVFTDAETGAEAPSRVLARDTFTDRATLLLAPTAAVPPFGYRTFKVGARPPAEPVAPGLGAGLVLSSDGCTIKVDPDTGGIASWSDDSVGAELVRPGERGLNAFHLAVRENLPFDVGVFDEEEWTGRETWETVVDIGRFMSTKEILRPTVISVAREDDGGLRSSIVVASTIAAVLDLETRYSVERGSRRVDITNTVRKHQSIPLEAGYFAFPFNLPEPAFDLEGPGYTFEPGQQLAGSMFDHYAVHRWLRVRSLEHQVVMVCADAALVSTGGLHVDRWMRAARVESADVFAYAFNQSWWTNFPSRQLGTLTMRYSLQADALGLVAAAHQMAGRALSPLLGFTGVAGHGDATRPPAGSFVTVVGDQALVSSLSSLGGGANFAGIRLGVQEVAGEHATSRLVLGEALGVVTAARRVDLTGAVVEELAVTPSTVEIILAPSDLAFVEVELRSD